MKAALAYFGWVFGAGFLMGSVRVPVLVPRLGERMAELLEMPVMFAVIWFASRWVVRRFALPPAAGVRWRTGLVALALMIGAELSLAILLQNRSLGEYIGSRDPVSGSVYLAMLGVFAAMPYLQAIKAPTNGPGSQ
jgi:hypothetical protein